MTDRARGTRVRHIDRPRGGGVWLCGIALSLLLAASAWAMELPAPPSGFSWREVPEIKAAFLEPRGWHFKREVRSTTLALFITREDIDKEGMFKTGLTINVLRHLERGAAVEYAKALIAQLAARHEGTDLHARQFGALQAYGCRYKARSADHAAVVAALTVANPKTGTVYLFLFEAPEATWPDAWSTGEAMMSALLVDDDV